MKSKAVPQRFPSLSPPAHCREEIGPHAEEKYVEILGNPVVNLDLVEDVKCFRKPSLIGEDYGQLDRQVHCFGKELPTHTQKLFGGVQITKSLEGI